MQHNVTKHKFIRVSPKHSSYSGTFTADTDATMKDHMWELVSALAPKNPDWTFVLTQGWANNENTVYFAGFKVVDSYDVELGKVLSDTRYSSNAGAQPAYLINSKHLASRRGEKKTTKLDVAIREIKKTFRPDTQDEVIATAIDDATETYRDVRHKKRWASDRLVATLKEKAYVWVRENCLDAFSASVDEVTQKKLREQAELEMEIKTVEDIGDKIDTDKSYLIIKDGSRYIVRIDDNVKLCDDSSLPEEVRSKLGMLKLVEVSQFIDNVGCRVNDNTFVVVKESTDELNA